MGSSAAVTVNDTSERIFRDMAVKEGGFEGNIGIVLGNNSISTAGTEDITDTTDVGGTEDVVRSIDLLRADQRDKIEVAINALKVCSIDKYCEDKNRLETRAETAWDRALSLLDEYDANLELQLDDIKAETLQRILLLENNWRRAAGDSLNCAVFALKNEAEVQLARRLAAVASEGHISAQQQQTQAIAQAFTAELNATMEPQKLAFNGITQFWQILRGARTDDVTDREYTEDREVVRARSYTDNKSESTRQFTSMGRFYHRVTDTSNASGTYDSDLNDAYSAATSIAGAVPSA